MNFREVIKETIYSELNEKKNNGPIMLGPKTSKSSGFTKLDNVKNAIFLAGPCPRHDYDKDWRFEAFDILKNIGFTGYVLNPTNENYDVNNANELILQTEWEWEAMCKASAIVFWLPRSEDNPGFTSNVEIGMWITSPGVFVGMPEGDTKNANRYIKIKCEKYGVEVHSNLKDLLSATVLDLNRGGKSWFTSDTHFNQERTLTLSRRPFKTVNDMNFIMASNWNKRVRMTDTVYHLGDFGENFDMLDCLNFGTFHFVKGNYESEKIPEIMKELKKKDNVIIHENNECTVQDGDLTYILRHEPLIGNKVEKDKLYLFGHIHGRHMYMRNGIDVGQDAHNYKPIDMEEVNWRMNAVLKYVDDNVFTEYVK